jgi:hypothetical protein
MSVPLECWTIDLGDSSVKIDEAEAHRVRPALESLSTRVITVTDIFGCETWVMRDKIKYLAYHTLEGNDAARKRSREYDAAIDALDPEGAEKDWDK